MASQALENGHAATSQKCFDSGLQYVHGLDMGKKTSVPLPPLWPQGQQGAQPPTPTSYLLHEEAKAKAEAAAAGGESCEGKGMRAG